MGTPSHCIYHGLVRTMYCVCLLHSVCTAYLYTSAIMGHIQCTHMHTHDARMMHPRTHTLIARCTRVLPTLKVEDSPSTRHSTLLSCLALSPSCLRYAFTAPSSSFNTPRQALMNSQSELERRFRICRTSSLLLLSVVEGVGVAGHV